MKVYAACERQDMTLHIAPAAHVGGRGGCPADWFREDGAPRSFTVHFSDGAAEVDDQIGRYLVAHGMARKTRLILPAGIIA